MHFSYNLDNKGSNPGLASLSLQLWDFSHFRIHRLGEWSKNKPCLGYLGLPPCTNNCNWETVAISQSKLSEFDRRLPSDLDSNNEIVSTIAILI